MSVRTIIIQLLLLFLVSNALIGQESTINYISSSSEIANPERGWYDDYYSHTGNSSFSTNYNLLNANEIIKNRESDHITLVLRLFYLHEFLDENNVSSEYIEKIQSDFDSIRYAGVKCIIRFAYSASQNAEVWDATPDKVLSHIESLGDVLTKNSDIIAGVQAGFIGAWGEWYYTKNFAGTSYVPDETDQENRRKLVEALLDVLPEHVSVQGRTPAIMRNILQSEESIAESEAFNGSIKSRVGHHNDCFLANKTDYGTYLDIDADIAYLNQTTKYTIAGGETCDASNDYSNCENSLDRMKALHWTYLNRDYNKDVYEKWENQGCYDEINIALGYRIYLKTATIDDSVSPGSKINLSFSFSNVGYAAPTQYKPIQLVLTNTESKQQTTIDYKGTNDDIRYWLSNDIIVDGEASIPDSLDHGNYTVSIKFADQDAILAQNPAYSIQLANVGLWDIKLGVNRLNHIVSVGSSGIGALPEVPETVNTSALSETEIEVSWVANAESLSGFEIMRSRKNDQNWILISELGPEETNFTDKELDPGTLYSYMVRSINEYESSNWSDIKSVSTLGVSSITLNDANFLVYPNPLKDNDLVINFNNEEQKRIEIYNTTGHLIYNTITRSAETIVPYTQFKPGVYHLRIKQNDGIMTSKIIVY